MANVFLTPNRRKKQKSQDAASLLNVLIQRDKYDEQRRQFKKKQSLSEKRFDIEKSRETRQKQQYETFTAPTLKQELATKKAKFKNDESLRSAEKDLASKLLSLGKNTTVNGDARPITAKDILSNLPREILANQGRSESIKSMLETLHRKAGLSQLKPIPTDGENRLKIVQDNVLSTIDSSAASGNPISSGDKIKLLEAAEFIPKEQAKDPVAIRTLKFKLDKLDSLEKENILPKGYDRTKAMLRILGAEEPRDFLGEFIVKQEKLIDKKLDAETRRQKFEREQALFNLQLGQVKDITTKNLNQEIQHNLGVQMGKDWIKTAVGLWNNGVDIERDVTLRDTLNLIRTKGDPQGRIVPALKKEIKKRLPNSISKRFLRVLDRTILTSFENIPEESIDKIKLPEYKPLEIPEIKSDVNNAK